MSDPKESPRVVGPDGSVWTRNGDMLGEYWSKDSTAGVGEVREESCGICKGPYLEIEFDHPTKDECLSLCVPLELVREIVKRYDAEHLTTKETP